MAEVSREQREGTALRAAVAEAPACSMPNCADMISSLKLTGIHAQCHLFCLSLLIHTAKLLLLVVRKHALEMLLVAVVDVRVSCRRADR
jgi:hypothetical protein